MHVHARLSLCTAHLLLPTPCSDQHAAAAVAQPVTISFRCMHGKLQSCVCVCVCAAILQLSVCLSVCCTRILHEKRAKKSQSLRDFCTKKRRKLCAFFARKLHKFLHDFRLKITQILHLFRTKIVPFSHGFSPFSCEIVRFCKLCAFFSRAMRACAGVCVCARARARARAWRYCART